jgi:uncharacterized protein (TIGR02301 family)
LHRKKWVLIRAGTLGDRGVPLADPPPATHNPAMRRVLVLVLTLLIALPQSVGGAPRAAAPETAPSAETPTPPPAPPAEPPPPVYEDQLLRLSEILGALSFLRGLCGADDAASWTADMRALLDAEHPGPERRRRLVGRFNHGFETFNAVYRICTPAARASIQHYIAEGQTLTRDVRSRYAQ